MVLEDAHSAFSVVVSVYVWGNNMVSDILVLLNYTLVFVTDLNINNLEVDLVVLSSEAVNYGVVGFSVFLVLVGLEGGDKDFVVVTMLGDQDVLVTATSSDGEAPNVIYIYIGYQFGPNLHFVRSDVGDKYQAREFL